MSNWVLSETRPVARKAYEYNACLWLLEELPHQDFTISELREIVKARRDGWKIQPGQTYIRQVQKFEGDLIVVLPERISHGWISLCEAVLLPPQHGGLGIEWRWARR